MNQKKKLIIKITKSEIRTEQENISEVTQILEAMDGKLSLLTSGKVKYCENDALLYAFHRIRS